MCILMSNPKINLNVHFEALFIYTCLCTRVRLILVRHTYSNQCPTRVSWFAPNTPVCCWICSKIRNCAGCLISETLCSSVKNQLIPSLPAFLQHIYIFSFAQYGTILFPVGGVLMFFISPGE